MQLNPIPKETNMASQVTFSSVRPIGSGVELLIPKVAQAPWDSSVSVAITNDVQSSEDGTLSVTIPMDVHRAWMLYQISSNSSKKPDAKPKA